MKSKMKKIEKTNETETGYLEGEKKKLIYLQQDGLKKDTNHQYQQ